MTAEGQNREMAGVENTAFCMFALIVAVGLLVMSVDVLGVWITSWGVVGVAGAVDLIGFLAMTIYRRQLEAKR